MSGAIRPVVRDTDSGADLRHGLSRMESRQDEQEKSLSSIASKFQEHVIRCEGASMSAARDLSDLKVQVASMQTSMATNVKWGAILLLIVLAVQVLGVERAWNLTDSIKVIRHAVPLPLPEK